MEEEFISCYEATSQALWLRNFITSLKSFYSIVRPLSIYCHNLTAIFFSKSNKSGSHNKHINIKVLIVREHIKKQEAVIDYVKTKLNIEDPMTKVLLAKLDKDHVNSMRFSI